MKQSNLILSMLLNPESKRGFLTNVHAECAEYILDKWGLYLHLQPVFNEEKLKYCYNIVFIIYIYILVFQSFIFKCVNIPV